MSDHLFDAKPVLEFDNTTDRRNFLRWSGLVGFGAALVAGGVGSAEASAAQRPAAASGTQRTASDIDILNYALTLEYLEADFYTKAISSGFFSDRELELLTPIREHEQTHVSAVASTVRALGGTPVTKPRINYPATTFAAPVSILFNAQQFEETGVSAYHGQVTLIHSPDVLAAAASIAGVESRHAGVISSMLRAGPFPHPIEEPKTKEQTLAVVGPFIQ